MEIRADLTTPASVIEADWQWLESPQTGVSRVMLDRVGDEVAVATSFVRYAAESSFPEHDHARGEEFIVLEGEFGDEHGRYPPGTDVRNPPGTHHAPFSDPGCLIWVKLRQYQTDDLTPLVTRLDSALPESGHEHRELHRSGTEVVAEIVAAAGETIALPAGDRPQEILVLEGSLSADGESIGRWSWLRRPAGCGIRLETDSPCRLFWKTRPDV